MFYLLYLSMVAIYCIAFCNQIKIVTVNTIITYHQFYLILELFQNLLSEALLQFQNLQNELQKPRYSTDL